MSKSDFVICAGVYSGGATSDEDYATAKIDYDKVKGLYKSDAIGEYDAAVIRDRAGRKVQISDKHEQDMHTRGWEGAGWGLAAGVAVALFPAAAIGGGLLAATTGGGAAIGMISGHVSAGMSRGDLHELGKGLDDGQAAVIVSVDAGQEDAVTAVLTGAKRVISKPLKIDADALKADLDDVQSDAS